MKYGLSWNQDGERRFEAGLDRGVLFTPGNPGVAWNGLISVGQSPTGATPQAHYIDGVAYYQHMTIEEIAGTIQAYTYPDEFLSAIGYAEVEPGVFFEQQDHLPFGISYRTKIGNDLVGLSHNYRIHLIYNMLASPSTRSNASLLESINPETFSWGFVTTPIKVNGRRHLAKIHIDRNAANSDKFDYFEYLLYGSGRIIPSRMPTITEVVELFSSSYRLPSLD